MNFDRQTIEKSEWVTLNDNEKVKGWAHPSIYPYLPIFIIGFFLIIGGILFPFLVDINYRFVLGLSTIFLGILVIVVEYIRYVTVVYLFTDKRIIRKTGVLDHNKKVIKYRSVEKIESDKPLIGRILNYGDITVNTASQKEDDIIMSYVPDFDKAKDILSDYTIEE